jgi:hypothetical protein
MGQVPASPSTFATRAMPPVRNPIYAYNQTADFKRTAQPTHALERPPQAPAGVDPRLTVRGDTSRAGDLTPVVGMAYQTPYNVWGMYPA